MCYCLGIMYLRCTTRRKNGKRHRYWSVVESRRLSGGKTARRQVLYLGEINDSQQAGWRKTLEVFDSEKRRYCQLSLFPSDRPRSARCPECGLGGPGADAAASAPADPDRATDRTDGRRGRTGG